MTFAAAVLLAMILLCAGIVVWSGRSPAPRAPEPHPLPQPYTGRHRTAWPRLTPHRVLACPKGMHRAPRERAADGFRWLRATWRDRLRGWQRRCTPRTRQRLRWKLWGLLVKSRRVCPANAHGALIWRTRSIREIGVGRACRDDYARNGSCYCGNLRDDDRLRALPAAACARPDGTAPAPASGAVPLIPLEPMQSLTAVDGFPAITQGRPFIHSASADGTAVFGGPHEYREGER